MATESFAVYGVGRSYFLTVEPYIGPVSQAVEFELPCCRGQSFGRSKLRAPPPGRAIELRAVDIFIVKPVQKVGGKDAVIHEDAHCSRVGTEASYHDDDVPEMREPSAPAVAKTAPSSLYTAGYAKESAAI